VSRHPSHMRTLSLLLLSVCALALTPKDETDIRTAIEEHARKENSGGSREIWTERGPIVYQVRKIEPLTADVAMAEAEAWRTGAFAGHLQYLFILTRTRGQWNVVKKVQVGLPLRFLPISAAPRFLGCGSSDCPN
jgi:hypothetical protein